MMNQFHVGDSVWVPVGRGKSAGVIVEDRGSIGVGRRRLYRIEVAMDPFDHMTVELPADEFEPITETNRPKPLSQEEVMEFLKVGGLIAILRSNLNGGPNQPRVWLCRDSLGNVTHTFVAERGLAGGATVPFFAVHQGKVFRPESDSVLNYLRQSFGLTEDQAWEVLHTVGVAP